MVCQFSCNICLSKKKAACLREEEKTANSQKIGRENDDCVAKGDDSQPHKPRETISKAERNLKEPKKLKTVKSVLPRKQGARLREEEKTANSQKASRESDDRVAKGDDSQPHKPRETISKAERNLKEPKKLKTVKSVLPTYLPQLDANTKKEVEDRLMSDNKILYIYEYSSLNQNGGILSIKLRDYANGKIVIQHIPVVREKGIFRTSWLSGKTFKSLEGLANGIIAKEKLTIAILKIKNLTRGLNAAPAVELERKYQEWVAEGEKKWPRPRPLMLKMAYWTETFNVHPFWEDSPVHPFTPRDPGYLMCGWCETKTDLPFEVWAKDHTVGCCHNVNYNPELYYLSKDRCPPDGKYLYVLDCHEEFLLITDIGKKNNHDHHHSSIVQGGAVLGAGHIQIKNGQVVVFNNESGHYQPPIENFAYAYKNLLAQNIPIESKLYASCEQQLADYLK